MAAEGSNFSTDPGIAQYVLARGTAVSAATTGAWIPIGPARQLPVVIVRGGNTTTVGVTFQTYFGDDTPLTATAGVNVFATVMCLQTGLAQPTVAGATLGSWVRAIISANTTTGATVEAFYLANKGGTR